MAYKSRNWHWIRKICWIGGQKCAKRKDPSRPGKGKKEKKRNTQVYSERKRSKNPSERKRSKNPSFIWSLILLYRHNKTDFRISPKLLHYILFVFVTTINPQKIVPHVSNVFYTKPNPINYFFFFLWDQILRCPLTAIFWLFFTVFCLFSVVLRHFFQCGAYFIEKNIY